MRKGRRPMGILEMADRRVWGPPGGWKIRRLREYAANPTITKRWAAADLDVPYPTLCAKVYDLNIRWRGPA